MSHVDINASTLEIAKNLIARQSVTPVDAGCQAYIAEYLGHLGFDTEHMDFEDTQNIWSVRGNAEPVFVFAGHTDVVPAGDINDWQSHPFEPEIREGYLYGRGAADMKGSIAAMLTATRRFVTEKPHHKGKIGFLITSDEEGPFINGTVRVIEVLQKRNQAIDYCLVGEPSSSHKLGDVIKIGRRGSLTGWITFNGKQGHVAYPHLATNAIHLTSHFVHELSQIEWDSGNQHFPPTSLQVTNFASGVAGNVIPGKANIEFNLRYSTEQTAEQIQSRVEALAKKYDQNAKIEWKLNGEPFLTQAQELIQSTISAINKVTNITAKPETSGGTSDGRFIAKTGAQIVELGPVNQTIHQINECILVEDLERLSEIYYNILCQML